MKLAASAADRLGILLVGSGLVPPLIQGTGLTLRADLWIAVGVLLHFLAHGILRYLRLEE